MLRLQKPSAQDRKHCPPPSRHWFDKSMRSIDAERLTAWSKGYDAAHRGSYPDFFNEERALNLGQP